MRKMSKQETLAFLAEGTRTGKLATVRDDGRPHVAPIWFVVDGEQIVFNTGADSVKAANMSRDPRVSLCVDEQQPLYSYVIVEGTVTFSQDLEEMLPWSTRIAARYMGADLAEQYGQRNAVPGELLVRITPTRFITAKDVAA